MTKISKREVDETIITDDDLSLGAWEDWTPTFANFTKGSATIVAKFKQIGKTVHFRVSVTLAADSVVGASPTIGLPVPAVTYPTNTPIGVAYFRDASVPSVTLGRITISGTTATIPTYFSVVGSLITHNGLSAVLPFTWATGDYILCTGTYEAD